MRRFKLIRSKDKSGVSGEGVIAEGCTFDDGRAILVWMSGLSTIEIAPSIEVIKKLHGHSGSTKVCFLDPEDEEQSPDACFPFRET